MKYFVTVSFIATILLVSNLQSQTVKIDSVFANYGDTVLVPLEFYGYSNVGALTLFIEYDTSALEYVGMTNLIPEGQGTLTNATVIQGTLNVVGIAWSATNGGVNFPDGKYMDLKFAFSQGASDLIFYEPSCEIVDWDVNPISSTYIDGRVDHLTGVEDLEKTEPSIYTYSNRIVIKTNPSDNMNIQVYDILGRMIHSSSIKNYSGYYELILNHEHSGFYIVKVSTNNNVFSEKLYINNNE